MASLVCLIVGSPARAEDPCHGLHFLSSIDPPLTGNEKSLVCPSEKKGAWSRIPPSQRRFHLIRFLQARGYNQPVFRTSPEGDLKIFPGPISRVQNITMRLAGDVKIPKIQWNWLGRSITPEILDEIEKSAGEELQKRGYPCAEARATVPNPSDGQVFVDVTPGEKSVLVYDRVRLSPELEASYSKRMLSRFYAFEDGQEFDDDLLELSTQRMEQSGIVDSGYFLTGCSQQKLNDLQLRGSISPPRLTTIGLGVDTEGIFKLRASWRHSRIGNNASSLEFSLLASKYLQSFKGNMNWYVLEEHPRFYLQPDLEFRRNSEQHYESYTLLASLLPSYSWDTSRERIRASLGPSVELTKTVRGSGVGLFLLPMLKFSLSYLTHDLELALDKPEQGTLGQISVSYSDQNLFLMFPFFAFSFWEKTMEPGRTQACQVCAGSTLCVWQHDPLGWDAFRLLPFLPGGSDSLRGFSRLELPGAGKAAHTSAYIGIEQRLLNLLPWKLQPLVFMDFGAAGFRPFSLGSQVFGSPGIGLRWDSPIGVIRGTLAHGILWGSGPVSINPHWQFYIGLGEEF
ncbi:MAG: hypothetical protein R3B54_18770 [Bdellovibrionota bacterium]